MKVVVYRDQAVWEREVLEVEVPDGTPPDQLLSAAQEALDAGKFTEIADTRILNSVEGIDTVVELERE